MIPTELFAENHPMVEQLADENQRNLLLMDDGLDVENPQNYRPFSAFSAKGTLAKQEAELQVSMAY